jgi:SAM-dependent methyltransferase
MRKSEVKRLEKDFHDRLGLHYEKRWVEQPRFKWHYRRIAQEVRRYFRSEKNYIMVDVGCGTGRGCLYFTDAVIIGLDVSISLLEICKRKAKYRRISNVNLVLCDAENPPLRDRRADLVTFYGTLHHLPDSARAVHKASTLLKEGGIMSIHEPNIESSRLPWILGSPLGGLRGILRIQRERVSPENEELDFSPNETSLSLSGTEVLCLNSGLAIIERKTVWLFGIIPLSDRLPQILLKIYYGVANTIDRVFERLGLYTTKAGAIFIVARKV